MAFKTLVGHNILHGAQGFISTVTRTAEYVANWANPNLMPEATTIMELGLKGWITETAVDEILLLHGISTNLDHAHTPLVDVEAGTKRRQLWNQVYWAQQELPALHESFTLANRGLLSDEDLETNLRRLGFYNAEVRAKMTNLRYEVPGSSDLVRFSVRHVFEPDLIAALGYNDEFNATLDFFHRLQGLNYPIFSGPFGEQYREFLATVPPERRVDASTYERYGLEEPTWAQAFWWSHWVTISPQQAYEAYFRLRPGRNEAFDPPFARGINFTFDNLLQSLRVNDYPKKLRPILAAIAHRIPGIRFLRQLRATEVFTQADVKELLLRQGYSDGDASVLAESIERADRDQRRKLIEQQAKGQLAKYWELGAIDSVEYRRQLVQHGLTAQEAQDTVVLADLDLKYQRLKQVVQFVRRQMLAGTINGAQAADQLRQAGVVDERIVTYINDWQLEVQAKHREVSAQKAVQWACKGLITLDDLRNRLANLNYLPADSAALVAEAELCQATLATRAAAKADRERRQAERQLVQQQKAAAQAIVTARRQLASHGSPAQLRKWYCAGHVGQGEVYSRLRFLGWPDADITRLIGECQSAKSSGKGGQRGGATLGG